MNYENRTEMNVKPSVRNMNSKTTIKTVCLNETTGSQTHTCARACACDTHTHTPDLV